MVIATGNARQGPRPWHSLTGLIDAAASSHARAIAILCLIALVSFLPGLFSIPPTDRDESRFAQATKQMLETGDFIDIRFQDEVRYKKPVGIYWLQAGVVQTAETLGIENARATIGLYRIPSVLGALGAVLLTYWTALAFVSRRGAVLAGLMMATSILLNVEARIAKTDAMLLLTIMAAMGALARAYLWRSGGDLSSRAGWALPAIFWTALAAGVLLKGPLIFMIVGLTVAALVAVDRSARWLLALRPALGLIWFALLVTPWFAAILGLAGGTFIAESLGKDMLAKVASGQESHGAPPGTYFVAFWATFWPAAALAGLAVPAAWASRDEPATRFLLAWVVPSWLVFEIVATKLPHYVLPLYPAIAILIACALERDRPALPWWLMKGTIWLAVPPVVFGLGGLGVMIAAGAGPAALIVALAAAAAAIVFGVLGWWRFERDGAERALLRGTAASVLLMVAAFGAMVPSFDRMFPSAALERAVRNSTCPDPAVAIAGYHEPSTVFLIGTETLFTDGAAAAEFLSDRGCRVAAVERRAQENFAVRADELGLSLQQDPPIEGRNINGMRPLTLFVYRLEGGS